MRNAQRRTAPALDVENAWRSSRARARRGACAPSGARLPATKIDVTMSDPAEYQVSHISEDAGENIFSRIGIGDPYRTGLPYPFFLALLVDVPGPLRCEPAGVRRALRLHASRRRSAEQRSRRARGAADRHAPHRGPEHARPVSRPQLRALPLGDRAVAGRREAGHRARQPQNPHPRLRRRAREGRDAARTSTRAHRTDRPQDRPGARHPVVAELARRRRRVHDPRAEGSASRRAPGCSIACATGCRDGSRRSSRSGSCWASCSTATSPRRRPSAGRRSRTPSASASGAR